MSAGTPDLTRLVIYRDRDRGFADLGLASILIRQSLRNYPCCAGSWSEIRERDIT